MSDPWGTPWSDHPNAPQIPSWDYRLEKGGFAGFFSGAIAYGPLTHLSICAHRACSTYLFRDCHRPVLPMYVRIA